MAAYFLKEDLDKLTRGLERLQKQLPTHQVAGTRRGGEYLKAKMIHHAKPMYLDGKVEKSIGWAETHGVSGGIVGGRTTTLVVGPGASGPMPRHAPLMESGWTQGWPNITRIGQWAQRRIPSIEPREVFYIARALAAHGALSPRNPRAQGETGYEYVRKTFEMDGDAAEKMVLDETFGHIKSTLDGI
jgi:hypothetical protein